jgi:uncharacterized membrane protein YraQ (UPF0718 family)
MKNNQENKKKRKNTKTYFLILTLLVYLIIYIINPAKFLEVINYFLNLIKKIILPLIIILLLMILTNLFFDKKHYLQDLRKANKHLKTGLSIIGGIVSSGPIYVWYPLLKNLKEKGLENKYLAIFLYNRSIKLALLPILIGYFGIKFTIILTIVMILVSILQGELIELIIKKEKIITKTN